MLVLLLLYMKVLNPSIKDDTNKKHTAIAFVIEISGLLFTGYQILSNDSNKKHTAIAFVIEISGLLSTGYQILSNDTNKKHTAIAFIEISGFLSTGYQILSNDSNIYSRISAVHKQAKTAESILVSTIRFPVNKQLVIVIVKALRSNLSVVWEDSVQIEHAKFSIVSLISAPPAPPGKCVHWTDRQTKTRTNRNIVGYT